MGSSCAWHEPGGTRCARQYLMRLSHTNVDGLSRTLLAAGTLGTLVCTDPSTIFGGNGFKGIPSVLREDLLFGLLQDHLFWARAIAGCVLLLVISGYRPKLTALPHWWVTVSFAHGCAVPDGGDHVATILTLLMIPVAITDPRKNHWHAPVTGESRRRVMANEVAWVTLQVMRIQVAFIYAYSAVAKLSVPEWANGTALYYWLTDPTIGLAKAAHSWAVPILANRQAVMLLSSRGSTRCLHLTAVQRK